MLTKAEMTPEARKRKRRGIVIVAVAGALTGLLTSYLFGIGQFFANLLGRLFGG